MNAPAARSVNSNSEVRELRYHRLDLPINQTIINRYFNTKYYDS